MPRPFLVVPLLAAAVAGIWLGRGTAARWRDLRAARTYELTAAPRAVLLRAGAAALCLICAFVLAVAMAAAALPQHSRFGSWTLGLRPAGSAADAGAAGAAPGAEVRTAAPSGPAPSGPAPSPSGARAVPPVETAFSTIGHPADGELMEARIAGSDGRPRTVRVWLPAEYRTDRQAHFPVIVLHSGTARKTADAELPDVFDGVASAVKLGRSRPFVVVAPEAPSGTEHPCELIAAAPQAVTDDEALRTAVGAAFRTLPAGPGNWGALGVESGAPCAAAAGLARPDLYGAAAAVSGRYDATALAGTGAEAPADATTRLLLAAAKADGAGVAAARGLRTALHDGKGAAARADVRVSDIVQDYTHERERLRLVRVAVQFLAENLAKPS